MDMASLFQQHQNHVIDIYHSALEHTRKKAGDQIDAVLIHSGSEGIYFGDDKHIPFETYGHFLHWLPVLRPDQMVLFQPDQQPIYYQVVRKDFWYDQSIRRESWWQDRFNIVALDSPEQVIDHLPSVRRIAFLGGNLKFARQIGCPEPLQNHRHLLNYLDYHRACKTPYEIEQIRAANARAMKGHLAAEDTFRNGGSELDIHNAFLNATEMQELESPYNNIVGLDRNAAILHYQTKQRISGADSKVLLIDAGSRVNGYCSDITRTYTRPGTHPVFEALCRGVEQLELDLVSRVKVGFPYKDIHKLAHEGVLNILIEHKIVSGDVEKLREDNISKLFLPHGVGHLLGLQVHDVSGHFKDETGEIEPPPEGHKALRLTRNIDKGWVITIEPGLYFIPLLLDAERNSNKGKCINWKLVDELTPFGGIRFEDNIAVTESGPENLTR